MPWRAQQGSLGGLTVETFGDPCLDDGLASDAEPGCLGVQGCDHLRMGRDQGRVDAGKSTWDAQLVGTHCNTRMRCRSGSAAHGDRSVSAETRVRGSTSGT